MCGIAGFIGEDETRIRRMTAALRHRGPDGNAVAVGNGASLGHARLAILDPRPEGDQPMWNDAHTIAIVYNGEMYNFRELADKAGLQCRTKTDTEVLLKLYEREGMAFVERLRGMFAFAIYDTRDRSLHLARDPSGIKPLFLTYVDGKPHFASELRSLLRALPTKPKLNLTALSQYVRLQYVPGPHTLCEGIEMLPAGTVLRWKGGEEKRITVFPNVTPHSFSSKADFQERFPALMDDSVRAHLISDKPVGIFLSGGMDSSIVLHHMRRHVTGDLRTYTVRFDATEEEGTARFNTDADLAAKTAKHYDTHHTELLLTAEMFRDSYGETAKSLDQPNADSVSVAQFLLSREAKKHVDVVLNGSGGDELFGGYPRYRVARILKALRVIPAPLRGAMGGLFGHPGDVLRLSPGAALAERLLARSVVETTTMTKGNWFDPHATTRLFNDSYEETGDPVRDFMEFDRALWLIDESLRLADATTMGSGLEARVPFLDREIIAASHATPAAWHVTLDRTKALLKDTYRPYLPEHLFSLSKASFYPPLAKWIRRETSRLVEEALEHPRIAEFFDVPHLRDLFEKHRAKEIYALHPLSTVTQLMAWFDAVYDAG